MKIATIKNINIPREEIHDFCKRWRVKELALFGSALRSNLNPSSDVDLLVTFDGQVNWSLLDHIRMEQELGKIFGRKVDLLSKPAVERSHNWLRRQEILNTAEGIYGP